MKDKFTIGLLSFREVSSSNAVMQEHAEAIGMLRDEIKNLGHVPKIYHFYKSQMFFGGNEAIVLEKNKKIIPCDILFPRFSVTNNLDLEVSLLKQFNIMGIRIINDYQSILNAKNKLATMQILTSRKIPVPRTVVVRKFEYLDAAIRDVGGYPVILKSPYGTFGCGVVIVESSRSLYSALDLLVKSMRSTILMIQEYVAEAGGADYRAFVVGERVVASMKRQAVKGDFRSNLHLGGEGQSIELTDMEKKIAVRAAKALGLKIAGVDILRSKDGPVIMEVNANPGLIGITKVTGINVAKEIVKFAVQEIKSSV